jgi:uncharacterized membrane protein YfcA
MLPLILALVAAGGTYWYARKRNIAPRLATKISGAVGAGGALAYLIIAGMISSILAFWPLALALPVAGGYFYLKSKKDRAALPPKS